MKRNILIALMAFALMPVAASADSWGVGFSYNSGGCLLYTSDAADE